jgi:hypothetical protein
MAWPRAALRAVVRAPSVWRARARDRAYADKARHKLAICAIFREEAPFLKEWIEFHCGVGATHFYLYNNFSTDDFATVLAPFVAEGVVTLTDWPVPVGQVPAYRHCIEQSWKDARWLAFIDIDEFLFSPSRVDIIDVLDRYRDLPGLHVWQAFFGTSGHQERPPGPLIEAYTMRAPLTQTTAKSIVNPRMVRKADVHLSKYWAGESLDTARRPVARDVVPVLDTLRINHYWSRSMADMMQKIKRGDASTPEPRRLEFHLDFESRLNAERDDSILEIGRIIRARQAAAGTASRTGA